MAIAQYASMRSQLPALTATAVSGGNLTGSDTIHVSYQGRNRAGVNLPSAAASVSYSVGQKLQVTIPATARADGEDIHYWIISMGLSADVSTHVQLAIYRGYDDDQVTQRSLPATIEFTEDAHIALSATVADEASLPSGNDLLNGMLRGVTSLSKILRYDAESTATVDNVTVFSAATGRWIQYGAFSTYIVNTEDAGGCDQPIGSVSDASLIKPPNHPGDGSSGTFVRLWWILNRSEGVGSVTAGKRFNLAWSQNGASRSALLSNQAKWRLNGFVRLSDGTNDTADLTTGERDYVYGKTGAYVLEKDLLSGYAFDCGVAIALDNSELEFSLPDGADLRVRPFFFSQSGSPNPIGQLVGDVIYNTGNRRLIVPSTSLAAIALDGAGTIKNFDFNREETLIIGLAANTADQVLAINGDGVVTVEGVAPTLDATQVERAKVGTVSGVSAVGVASAYAAVSAGDTLTITVNHPVSGGNGVIRSDYPDTEIAGNSSGAFNPPLMRIYGERQSDGEIREFTGFVPLAAATQDIAIANWTDGAIASLPNAAPTFSLFHSDSPTAATASGSSDFTGDNYRWYVAYEYSGNQITSIDHGDGVYAAKRTVSEWDQTADEWANFDSTGVAYLDQPQQYSAAQRSGVTALSISSGTVTIDCETNNSFTLELTENVTTVAVTNLAVGVNFDIEIRQDGTGGRTVSGWASAFTWPGGTAPGTPTAADAAYILSFKSFDGVTIRSLAVTQPFS